MTKADLVSQVAAEISTTKATAERMVGAVFSADVQARQGPARCDKAGECVMFGAGRCSGDFVDPVERANSYPDHARTSNACDGAAPYRGRRKMVPTTSATRVRASPILEASPRRLRPSSFASRSAPSFVQLAVAGPRTDPTSDVGFPLAVSSLPRPRRRHRREHFRSPWTVRRNRTARIHVTNVITTRSRDASGS